MAATWRDAYFQQARSDFQVFLKLRGDNDIPLCQLLHYLQMTTEKMAKGFLAPADDTPYPKTHDAFLRFVQAERRQPDLQAALGFTRKRQFLAYLRGLQDIAFAIENLSPEGEDHPNPEYPWLQNGQIISPLEHAFMGLELQTPKMVRLLNFVSTCLSLGD